MRKKEDCLRNRRCGSEVEGVPVVFVVYFSQTEAPSCRRRGDEFELYIFFSFFSWAVIYSGPGLDITLGWGLFKWEGLLRRRVGVGTKGWSYLNDGTWTSSLFLRLG